MAFHKTPIDKPRVSKKFLTARNVEDMALAGVVEIIHSPDLVITDAARETAIDLKIKIINPAILRNREISNQSLATIPKSSINSVENSASASREMAKLNSNSIERISSVSGMRNENLTYRLGNKDEAVIRELVELIRQNWQPRFKTNKQLIIPA